MKEENKIMVSICVIAYNLEKYIAEALNSILMQKVNFTYSIVVGEDCSTDNTRQILQDYANKYPNKFKLLLHKKNLGIVANTAATLKECHGKYIALLDGDDYWIDPLKLQKQVDFLESHKEYSITFHNVEFQNETKNGITTRPFNKEQNSREYTYDEIVKTWSVAATSSMLAINNKQYQYFEKNSWFPVQDLAFFLCSAPSGKIYYMSDTMGVYRRLISGWVSTEFTTIKMQLNLMEYLNALYTDFHQYLTKETIDHILSGYYLYAANISKKNGSDKEYSHYIISAMSYHPQNVFEREIKPMRQQLQRQNNQSLHEMIKQNESRTNTILRAIQKVMVIPVLKHPIKKYKAYKEMLETYYKIRNIIK